MEKQVERADEHFFKSPILLVIGGTQKKTPAQM